LPERLEAARIRFIAMTEPVRLSYRLTTRASLERSWDAIADTDRFNLAVGAGFRFESSVDEAGSPSVRGSMSRMGLELRWKEEPFRFRKPNWFRVVRNFDNGPVRTLTASATLGPGPEGCTTIDYVLEAEPRMGLLRPLVALEMRTSTAGPLEASLNALVAMLDESSSEPEQSYLRPPPALPRQIDRWLVEMSGRLRDVRLAKRLVSFLRAAPEREQARMNPFALANAWGVPVEQATAHLVDAATHGLLGVRLDLSCPACLVPRRELRPDEPAPTEHCEGCGIALDPSFPESLALHFCPTPRVRVPSSRVECLGSPAQRPQVHAQDLLAPGESTDLVVPLGPGTYRLRAQPGTDGGALLELRPGEALTEASFVVGASTSPPHLRVRSAPTSLVVRNATGAPIAVVLERLVQPTPLMSLGRARAAFPALATLVPTGGYFAAMECTEGVALAARFATPDAGAKLERARVVHVVGDALLATYAEPTLALADLAALLSAGEPRLLVGLAQGRLFLHELGARSVPMGPAVDDAWRLASSWARPGEAAASADAFAWPAHVELTRRTLGEHASSPVGLSLFT
jgi:hypothetical protein